MFLRSVFGRNKNIRSAQVAIVILVTVLLTSSSTSASVMPSSSGFPTVDPAPLARPLSLNSLPSSRTIRQEQLSQVFYDVLPLNTRFEDYFQSAWYTLLSNYVPGYSSGQSYNFNFSTYNPVGIEDGGEALAETLALYYIMPNLLQNGSVDYESSQIVVSTFQELNNSLEIGIGGETFLPTSTFASGSKFIVHPEANLFFVLDAYALASFVSKTGVSLGTGFSPSELIGIGNTVLDTILGLEGTALVNVTNGLIIPMWVYNNSDGLFYADTSVYPNYETNIRLTGLYFHALAVRQLLTGSNYEDKVVSAYDNFIRPQYNTTGQTGDEAILVNSLFFYNTSAAGYSPAKIATLRGISSVLLMLFSLEKMLRNSANVTRQTTVREQLARDIVNILAGVYNIMSYDNNALRSYVDLTTTTQTDYPDIITFENIEFNFISMLISQELLKLPIVSQDPSIGQKAGQYGRESTYRSRGYLATQWDPGTSLFYAGFLGGGFTPFIEEIPILNWGVTNAVVMGYLKFQNQAKIWVNATAQTEIGNPITAEIILLFDQSWGVGILTDLPPNIGALFYEAGVYSTGEKYYGEIFPGAINWSRTPIFTSGTFNITPEVDQNGIVKEYFTLTDEWNNKIVAIDHDVLILGNINIDAEITSSSGETRIIRGVTEELSLIVTVRDIQGTPISGAKYTITAEPFDNTSLSLAQDQTLPTEITGVTQSNGRIQAKLDVKNWRSSYRITLNVEHSLFLPLWWEFFVPYVDNELLVNILDISALSIKEGTSSVIVRYNLEDLFGNVPSTAKVNVSLVKGTKSYLMAIGLSASGEAVLKKSVDSSAKLLSDFEPGTYQLVFSVAKTLFSDDSVLEFQKIFEIQGRTIFEEFQFQAERLSAQYGWLLSGLGGLFGLIGLFRNPIRRRLKLIRPCPFCGDYTSTKYPVCRNCGRTIDEEKEQEIISSVKGKKPEES